MQPSPLSMSHYKKSGANKNKRRRANTRASHCLTCLHKLWENGKLLDWGEDESVGILFGSRDPCDDCCCGACGSRKEYQGQSHCWSIFRQWVMHPLSHPEFAFDRVQRFWYGRRSFLLQDWITQIHECIKVSLTCQLLECVCIVG